MSRTTEKIEREDIWREVQAIGYEGGAKLLSEAEGVVEDVIELLRFHGREKAAQELRSTLSLLRSERDEFDGKALQLRSMLGDRR